MANTILGLFRTAGDGDPLADVKALAAWMAKQPANDYLGLQEAMVRVLEDLGERQSSVTPNRVLAVLELDRISTPIQARLLKQFLLPSLSDSVRQRLGHACEDLARWFAYTYVNLFEALQEFSLSQKAKGQLPGVAARLFHYHGQQAKYGLFRYERWMPGKWKSLHAAYEATLSGAFARVPFALAPDSPALEHYSPEQEYLKILLMQRVNTGNLRALQIEMAGYWLNRWVLALALTEPPSEGTGFWLDLGQGDGLLAQKPQSAQGALLYLDIAPLQKEIGNGLVELTVQMRRAGATALHAESAERLALLQRLEQLWRPKAKPTERRGVRVWADRPVDVATGLAEIVVALHNADPNNKALDRRFRHSGSAEVASGRVQPRFEAHDPGIIQFEEKDAGEWRMHDTSDSGCKLVSPPRQAVPQKLGSLLGIQDPEDTRQKIGIVRRLKNIPGGQTELGVEIVADNSLLIAIRPAPLRETGYNVEGIDVSVTGKDLVDALYLPPTNSRGRTPQRSIVVPALEYAERRRFFLNFNEKSYTIEFTAALERTKDWVWSGFDIVARRP